MEEQEYTVGTMEPEWGNGDVQNITFIVTEDWDTHIAVSREIEEDLDRVAEECCQILETREGLRRIKHPNQLSTQTRKRR